MIKLQKITLKELNIKKEKAVALLNPCVVCPRECRVDRIKTQEGYCKTKNKPKIHSAQPHFGEESCLVGIKGSGTIFFSSCNLSCVYCQNWKISQMKMGEEMEISQLASLMLYLEAKGCSNINLVSPSIWVPQIIESLILAKKKGLNIPLVFNTGGYDRLETLKLLDGIIDIYLPDIKYSTNKMSQNYSNVSDYWVRVQRAVWEMYKQVGDLKINKEGIAESGLLVRHLILPNRLAGTAKVMKFISSVSKNSYINIMDQYQPCFKSRKFPELNRKITDQEFKQAVGIAKNEGLYRFEHLQRK
ncbi:radical SAM protein [Candidatus Dojkabacteria bacterium]|nr:radical SAM protein [Candidatus Dojkabacteria bacterium]